MTNRTYKQLTDELAETIPASAEWLALLESNRIASEQKQQQREIDQIKDWLFADWVVEAEALAADARDEMATQEDALQIGLQ